MFRVNQCIQYYDLHDKYIYIYGYVPQSEELKTNLHKNGFCINGIIDKRYQQIKNPMVIGIEDVEIKHACDRDNVVIIIVTRSSITQEEVAKELYAIGYSQIIYAPIYDDNRNGRILSYMRSKYLNLRDGYMKYDVYPRYEMLYAINNMLYVVNSYMNTMEVLVQIDFVRSFHGDNTYNDAIMKFRNLPLNKFDYLNELYAYLYEDGDFPDNYLKYYMDNTKTAVFIEERKELYDIFHRNWNENGLSFFIESPASGMLNREGNFNLTDGSHRASFLYCVGSDYIPMLIKKSDFFEFYNMNGLEEFSNVDI